MPSRLGWNGAPQATRSPRPGAGRNGGWETLIDLDEFLPAAGSAEDPHPGPGDTEVFGEGGDGCRIGPSVASRGRDRDPEPTLPDGDDPRRSGVRDDGDGDSHADGDALGRLLSPKGLPEHDPNNIHKTSPELTSNLHRSCLDIRAHRIL